MNEMLSYCGLVCHTCPIFLATLEENKEEQEKKRSEIAKLCRSEFGMNYEISDITDCDGCRTVGGRLFSGCIDCTIRKCAQQKEIENCAFCPEYSCENLASFFSKDPSAKLRLDEIRKINLESGSPHRS